MDKKYLCIDLKTFYASVECVERGLDPFETDLVVADPSRGNGAICLAISPKMKERGIRNRCRIFEIPKDVKYITAKPRMNKYIKYSADIYGIYLKYVAKEDIHVYSIDEAFLDVTNYLSLYKMDVFDLAKTIKKDILNTIGITSTVGIGTNLYLAKIALDIIAKHAKDHIGYLDEAKFKEELWHHLPLSDFWQIGKGIERRLNKLGLFNMYDIAHANETILYKEFGINAELIIDHSKGIEPCTIKEIKAYKSKSNSISRSQILFENYNYKKAELVVKEMVDLASLDLIEKDLVTTSVHLSIGYSKDTIPSTGGSIKLSNETNVYSVLVKEFLKIYASTTNREVSIRRISISFGSVHKQVYEQLDLFTDKKAIKQEERIEITMNMLKNKFGKSAILRGINLADGATTVKRNKLVGGHNAE